MYLILVALDDSPDWVPIGGLIWLAMPIRFFKVLTISGQKEKGPASARPLVVCYLSSEA
jgi:hypothetical protein